MTTTMKKALGLVAALALATLAACGDNNNNNGTPDMAMPQGGGNDMTMMESCVMNPTTPVEILNACSNAQTGDPAKDAPYFPSLAPNGNLPPLP